MTLKRYLFEGAAAGTNVSANTAANRALTEAALHNSAGGSITFTAAAAAHGATGLEFVTSAATQYNIARFVAAAANNQLAGSFVFAYVGTGTNNASTADTSIAKVRNQTNDSTVLAFQVDANNQFRPVDAAAGALSALRYTLTPGTKYRVEFRVTANGTTSGGAVTVNLYTMTGTTPLATWTTSTANLGVNVPNGLEIGCVSFNQVMTLRYDDVQLDDGRTTEIGPYDPASTPLTVTVTSVPAHSSGTITITVPTTVTLTINATGGTGAGRTYRAEWGDGGTSPSQAGNVLSHDYTTAGTYTISYYCDEP